jgi:hypothetical protein
MVALRRHLDVAVLALELSKAMEWLAGEHVALARQLDGVTSPTPSRPPRRSSPARNAPQP